MHCRHLRQSAAIVLPAILAIQAPAIAADTPPAPAPTPVATTAATTRAGAPRQVVEEAVPLVVQLLLDKQLSPDDRGRRLKEIMRGRADLVAVSRIMLGKSWDTLPAADRDQFVAVLEDYLIAVYLPMMTGYAGEEVRVANDQALERGDHVVNIRVSENQSGIDRQVAFISCRLRQGNEGWRAIDVTVEGISIVRIFGAQFRPVLAKEGMPGLIKQLRSKIAAAQPPRP